MDVFNLTRTLIDIPSVTAEEEQVGHYLRSHLEHLCDAYGGGRARCEAMEVEPKRFNVFASFGEPVVTLSTHIDTVPPFVASREDDEFIWGRGACDAKGIIASMLVAAEQLLAGGVTNFGLLFVVGEELNSVGARHAAQNPRGSKFIINGEPTGNRIALGCKGGLRFEVIARGKAAHSGYPDLGESAIEKLIVALEAVRSVMLPTDSILGPGTLNIGTICGGRSLDVIPDEARAEIFVRLVSNSASTRDAIRNAVSDKVELCAFPEIPAIHLTPLEGLPTTVVAYTTDIPAFDGAWGKPFLFGPGTIQVAHTLEERVSKRELLEAVELYQWMVRKLHDAHAGEEHFIPRLRRN